MATVIVAGDHTVPRRAGSIGKRDDKEADVGVKARLAAR